MTVQELIDKLNEVEDKSIKIYVPMEVMHVVQATEYRVLTSMNNVKFGVVIK